MRKTTGKIDRTKYFFCGNCQEWRLGQQNPRTPVAKVCNGCKQQFREWHARWVADHQPLQVTQERLEL